ncbi:hypothetical protein E8E11_002591 [Didymella keratinophila]|nr:hypothetical protein E8E11_002591 [Didymella keratinophila]
MPDVTKTYQYVQEHAETDVDMNSWSKDQPVLYGPNFVGDFDPRICNIRTGEIMRGTVHHCSHGEDHNITKACYNKGHQAFCHEWMAVDGSIVRCGARYKVLSGGCGTHKMKNMRDSINLKVKNLISGKRDSIPWSELDDMGEFAEQAALQVSAEEQDKQAIFAKHKQAEEEANASKEPLPAHHAVYNPHLAYNETAIQRKRTEAAERKKAAAERKSEYQRTGPAKLKQKPKEGVPLVPGIRVELERRRLNGGKSSNKKSGKHNTFIFRGFKKAAQSTIPE